MMYLLLIGLSILALFVLWRFWANLVFAFVPRQRGYGRRRASEPKSGGFRLTASKPAWVKDKVIRLKALMPDAGCRKIAAIFNRRFGHQRNITIGKTCVSMVICKHLYEIQVSRKRSNIATSNR